MVRLPPPIVGVTPGVAGPQGVDGLVRQVEVAVAAGLEGLLLREHALEDGLLFALALECRRLMGSGWLAISDRLHVALRCEADAIQLGFRSLGASEARMIEESARGAVPGRRLAVGVSDHALPRREDLDWADFATLAPWAGVPGKGAPLGVDGFRACLEDRARAGMARPTWALGGLGPNDLSSVRDAGAQGAFVIRGMDWGGRPDRAVEKLLGAWGGSA